MLAFVRFLVLAEHGFLDADAVFANAIAVLFEAIHEAASPDEFRGEQAEPDKDREPAGAGRDDHNDADAEKGESCDDAKDAANLLDCAEGHKASHNGAPLR